ncbi:DHA1 family chloramphenicol resistance protein-like MFS transporter [Nocardia tenerifensis]|uniref:DHA1 family chloramphenicol resistance protein-like MFS transporter n=1 Tax=Nocardia tenerifensis TaxID=228006 RepID=A0A318JZ92_9NOCA|nr:Cmx/CmrA family chloramphenicol efflux MFS transporter [Nocardia tenerifensis]PXX62366.1 DHA1 family chloramphenicol resistance protein-like MFS transporter [Nocardia tenerifensis]
MPFAVYILGLSIFAQGTSELMLSGLLTELSTDLGVTIPQAGLLISAFALGMLVGAPVLAVATLRLPRRSALLAFLAVFVAAHVVGALTSDYWVLFGTRVVGAFVYAGFWSVAATTAIGLVPANARGKAMSIVAGGLTVATVVGLPAGTVIGQHLGWRAAFWTVAIMSALAMLGVLAKIPAGRSATQPDLRKELRGMVNPRLWLSYSTTALATAALLVSFAYLGALLSTTTDLADGWIPIVLVVYGVGSFLGIVVGGRTADAHPIRTLYVGITGLIVTSVLLALTAEYPVPVVALTFLLGAFGFGTNPTLNSRVFNLAPESPTLAPAFNVSSFNIGITVGPWLGGLAIGAGLGYASVAWIGATIGLAALSTVTCEQLLHRATPTSPTKKPELIHAP